MQTCDLFLYHVRAHVLPSPTPTTLPLPLFYPGVQPLGFSSEICNSSIFLRSRSKNFLFTGKLNPRPPLTSLLPLIEVFFPSTVDFGLYWTKIKIATSGYFVYNIENLEYVHINNLVVHCIYVKKELTCMYYCRYYYSP